MGNTKHITFEGRLRPSQGFDMTAPNLAAQIAETVKREARADRCLVESWTERVEIDYDSDQHMVFGAILTTSMHDCVPALADMLSPGTITKVDLDWSDASVYDVDGGVVVNSYRYDMSSETAR